MPAVILPPAPAPGPSPSPSPAPAGAWVEQVVKWSLDDSSGLIKHNVKEFIRTGAPAPAPAPAALLRTPATFDPVSAAGGTLSNGNRTFQATTSFGGLSGGAGAFAPKINDAGFVAEFTIDVLGADMRLMVGGSLTYDRDGTVVTWHTVSSTPWVVGDKIGVIVYGDVPASGINKGIAFFRNGTLVDDGPAAAAFAANFHWRLNAAGGQVTLNANVPTMAYGAVYQAFRARTGVAGSLGAPGDMPNPYSWPMGT